MPARAGMARLLGHSVLDLLVYALLAIAIVAAGVAVMFPSGALKPSYTGDHTIMLTLAPCASEEGRGQRLLDALAEHGDLRPATTRRGQELPLELLPGYLPDDTPMQLFSAFIAPPPGRTVAIDPDALARRIGCPVRDLVQSPEPPFTPERMVFPPAFVTWALIATALAGGLAWLFRRPGRGLPLARGTAPAAVALALSAALLAQLLPRLLAWVGLPLAPSNAADITRFFGEWPLVATALVVLVAPLAEEAFFRGVLLRRFVVAGRPRGRAVVVGRRVRACPRTLRRRPLDADAGDLGGLPGDGAAVRRRLRANGPLVRGVPGPCRQQRGGVGHGGILRRLTPGLHWHAARPRHAGAAGIEPGTL